MCSVSCIWYRSEAGITDTSGSISRWEDLIGVAHFTQSLAAQQPTLLSNVLTDHQIVRFNSGTLQNDPGLSADPGSNMDQLIANIATVQQPYTVGLIWQQWGPALGVFDGSGDDAKFIVFSTNDPSGSGAQLVLDGPGFHTVGTRFQSNTALQGTTVLNDAYTSGSQQFGVSFFVGNGANSKVINNMQLILSGNAGTDGLVEQFVLCGRQTDLRSGAYFDLVELMIFTGSLSTDSMTALTTYADNTYGINV